MIIVLKLIIVCTVGHDGPVEPLRDAPDDATVGPVVDVLRRGALVEDGVHERLAVITLQVAQVPELALRGRGVVTPAAAVDGPLGERDGLVRQLPGRPGDAGAHFVRQQGPHAAADRDAPRPPGPPGRELCVIGRVAGRHFRRPGPSGTGARSAPCPTFRAPDGLRCGAHSHVQESANLESEVPNSGAQESRMLSWI